MENRQNNGLRLLISGIIVMLLLVLFAGAVAFFWGAQVATLLGFGAQIEAAKMVPADTQLYVTASVNLQNEAGYENLKKLYIDNPDIQELFSDAQESLSEGAIEFETDVQPWLDNEIAFAIPTLTLEPEGSTPEFVLLMATRDVNASEAFLDKLFTSQAEEQGTSFEKKEYNGVSYWYQAAGSEADEDSVAALFSDFVIMTNSEALLTKTIDQSEAADSLAENESFKATIDALPSNSVMLAVFDVSSLIAESSQMSELEAIQPMLFEQAEAVGFIGMALTLQPDGIQLDLAQQYDLEKLPESTRALLNRPANANEVLNRIPAEVLFFVNSHNLGQIWQQSRQQLATAADFEQSLSSMEQETGINLDEDIFSWMNGEFALVLSEVNPSSSIPFAGYLLIGTDDTEAAQSGVDQLKSLLTGDLAIPITAETISETSVEVINNPNNDEGLAGFGFLQDLFLLAIPASTITTVVEAPNNAITSNAQFNAVSNRLPNENTGYFYLNVEALKPLAESNLSGTQREEYDKNLQPFLEPLRAIGGTSQLGLQNDSIQSTRLFFLMTEQP